MKRWVLKAGMTEIDGLSLEEAPMPQPAAGEIRVKVTAASLNARDLMILAGMGRKPGRDLVPLSDGAGVVDAVGAGVEIWSVGDRVISLYLNGWIDGPPHLKLGMGLGSADEDGMLAEYVVLSADRVTAAPRTLDDAQAATLPCAAVTAWNALQGDRPIGPGSKVLVLGTGGVSLFALVLARHAGAQVFATTSQDAKTEKSRALGAADVVNYRTDPDWGRTIFQRSGGIDRIVNAAGLGAINQSVHAAAPEGEIALIGLMTPSDTSPDPGPILAKAIRIRGIAVGSARMQEALVHAIDAQHIEPPIAKRFSFEQAKEAYWAMQADSLFGKIVIDIA